jgi:hypothetical protein
MNMLQRGMCVVSLALAGVACGRTHGFGPIEPSDRAGNGLLSSKRDASVMSDADTSSGHAATSALDAAPNALDAAPNVRDAATSARDAAAVHADASSGARAEVWIGELWSIAPLLCDPSDASWSAFTSPPTEPMGHRERVVLILDHGAGAALHGRIQFGQGSAPTNPGEQPYAGGQASFWLCSIQLPTKAVAYTLLHPVLTRDSLQFELLAGEVWNDFCHAHDAPCPGHSCRSLYGPVCTCDGGQCSAVERGPLNFNLALTSNTIEGDAPLYSGSNGGTAAQLRMRRVQ